MKTLLAIAIGFSLLDPSAIFAQTYTIKDLGVLAGYQSWATGINKSGQVVGTSAVFINDFPLDGYYYAPFRTAPNHPINRYTDYLGMLTDPDTFATGINASGQVIGYSEWADDPTESYAWRTAPNWPINASTDDLGSQVGYGFTYAYGINDTGQVVGAVSPVTGTTFHAFRTVPNQPINPATDYLDTLITGNSYGYAINAKGQVIGNTDDFAFRTAPNQPINPATDNLGTLGGTFVLPNGINASGQVVGQAETSSGEIHAFRTRPNKPINPATDDLGTLGGSTIAYGINSQGQVVGSDSAAGAFVYRHGVLYNLNDLIPASSGWHLANAMAINDVGQIVGAGTSLHGDHAYLLTPVLAPTLTSLSSTLTPSVYGEKLTFTATVTNKFGSVPTGQVAFKWVGNSTIGTANLNAKGVATITRNLNAAGYVIAAEYVGDINNHSSLSRVLRQRVEPATTAASLSSSLNPSPAGQPVTFTAQITSPTVTPTGPVTFTNGKTVLGTVQLTAGSAQLTAVLPSGSTNVTVTYPGDSNIRTSSASLTQVVQP